MPPIARTSGQQTLTTTANTPQGGANTNVVSINAGGLNALGGSFNVPGASGGSSSMQFQICSANQNPCVGGNNLQRINCLTAGTTAAAPTQIVFGSCLRSDGTSLLAVATTNYIIVNDVNGKSQIFQIAAAVTAGASGVTKNYTVTSTTTTDNFVTNSFWMQNNVGGASPSNLWTIVTCYGLQTGTNTQNSGTPGFVITGFNNCNTVNGVPTTTAGANIVSNGSLTAPNVGTIGGYIKIEIQKADATWQDVTAEILNWGFADTNQDGANCGVVNPNAIIRLQRLRDTNSGAGVCTYANSANSYDYWPNTLFDTREALLREPQPANNNTDLYLGGVIHYVTLDVTNLSKWFKNQAPYTAGSGNLVLTNNGYSVYFSDRRNNRDLNNQETGEYGFEDIVNPLNATGTPNGTLDQGEDFNGNGTLETYGQFPNFLGQGNQLPPLPAAGLPAAFSSFGAAGTIRPTTTVGRSAAMTNRAYLFRRALKLVNGTFGNIVTPGLTIASENPVYIQGDWNWNSTAALTDPHSETSVIADAVTLLSSNWEDVNVFMNPYDATQRVRGTNWYRLAIIGGKGIAFPWPAAGNPDPTFGTDGGAHNFLRYLETGSSTVNFRGSIATFYYSRQGIGTFKFTTTATNTVYSAPTRAYNFDTDFLDPSKLPPLTPVFRDVNMLGFSQETRPGR
jgi:hypothetical protein